MSYIDVVKDYAELAERHGLPQENGGVHIGMFLAWIINHRLESDEMREEAADELTAVRNREMTGLEFLCACCDEKLSDEDLSDEGNAFAEVYYAGGSSLLGSYLDDWGKLCGDDSPKSYEDSWVRYDQIAAIIDRRYHDWKNPPNVTIDTTKGATTVQKSPWWKFWG
jgi:hypothetical protein